MAPRWDSFHSRQCQNAFLLRTKRPGLRQTGIDSSHGWAVACHAGGLPVLGCRRRSTAILSSRMAGAANDGTSSSAARKHFIFIVWLLAFSRLILGVRHRRAAPERSPE